MKRSKLALWLKAILIGAAFCLLAVYLFLVPDLGRALAADNPDYASAYLPWLVFVSLTALPIAVALVFSWRVADEIGRDNSFSRANARSLRAIFFCALADAFYFLAGNIVLMLCNMSHPAVLLLSLLAVFTGIAVAVAAAALSHLVLNAAELREENESIV